MPYSSTNPYGDNYGSDLQHHNRKIIFTQNQCSHKYIIFGLEVLYSERGDYYKKKLEGL